jgi:hypothetical protein
MAMPVLAEEWRLQMMRAGRRLLVLAMATVLGAGVPAAAGSGAVQAATAMGRGAPVGSVPAIQGQLEGVSADSASDAWAVGWYFNSAEVQQPMIVHWNGTAWSQVPAPSPGAGSAVLSGVSALSPTDAWAVGGFTNSANVGQTFIVHWNGTAWSQVSSPDPGPKGDRLTSVSAVSPADIWAVGNDITSASVQKTLIVHWNGTAWSQMKSPSPPDSVGASLSSVSAVSGSNAWAAGSFTPLTPVATVHSLTLHWNGTAWSRVPSPNPGNYAQLTGVSALSGADAWAVGVSHGPANLALHWNGTAWSRASVPSPGNTPEKQLSGISAVSATDAWAVGYSGLNTRFAPFFTVTLQWNGTAWSRVPSPNPGNGNGAGFSQLFAVSALSSNDAWAVGTASSGPVLTRPYIMILHWDGTAWSAA